jgi:uncharacterized protein (TIGR03435 family)
MAAPMRFVLLVISLSQFVTAQAVENLAFEVASVKRSPRPEQGARQFFGPPRGGPGTSDPGLITWNNAALRNIVMTAYNIQTFLLEGPDWMANERYDIAVRVPAGSTKEQVRVMWQNLLKERFAMVLHRESKELSAYELTVAKGGSKLTPTDLPADVLPFTPADVKNGKDGVPEMSGSGAIIMIEIKGDTPAARMRVKALSLPEIAEKFANAARRPVIDKTGLDGKYDFLLEYTPDLRGVPPPPDAGAPAAPPGAGEPGTNLPTAVEKQLGLKLTSRKANVEVIVVDRAEKVPTEN